jgi:hypothetical protein
MRLFHVPFFPLPTQFYFLIRVINLYVRVELALLMCVEVMPGQVYQQLYLVQVDQLAVLDLLKTQKTLKRCFVSLFGQVLFVDTHQLIELKMATVFTSDRGLDKFLR